MTESGEENNIGAVDKKRKFSKLIDSLKVVFVVEHIFGIYRFSLREEQILPSTWKNKLYGLTLITVCISMYAIFMDIIPFILGETTLKVMIYEIPSLLLTIQYIVTVIITTFIFSKTYKEMFVTLADLESILMISDNFYQKASANVKKSLGSILIYYFILTIMDLLTLGKIYIEDLVLLPLFVFQKIEVLMFCFIIDILRSYLNIINEYITTFLAEKDNNVVSVIVINLKKAVNIPNMIGRPSGRNMKIRDLAKMYDTIAYICSTASNVFNILNLMTLASTFCSIVITIWSSVDYCKSPENNNNSEPDTLLSIVMWCVTELLTVAMMCFICERLRSMRNTTKTLVNQLIMDYALPKNMRMQAKAFMEIIEAWPLQVSIYDMFNVDISLVLKFISVSTTYLIIIIQISHLG